MNLQYLYEQYILKALKFLNRPALRPVLIVTGFTFFSRFLGFVRQFLVYTRMSRLESDWLLSANRIPEQISVILLMGTVYSSVLPIASQLSHDNKKDHHSADSNTEISEYLHLINLSVMAVLIVLCIILGVFMEPILAVFSPELWDQAVNAERVGEYVLAGRILLLLPVIFASQAILGVFLTMKKRFLVYSLAGIASNVGSIGALLVAGGDFVQVSIGMVIGGVIANIIYLIDAFRQGLIIPGFHLENFQKLTTKLRPKLTQTWSLFLPRIFIIDGFYVANLVINPLVQYPGQVTAFDLGTSIQGAFFIIVSSLGVVFFPNLSELYYNKKIKQEVFWRQLMRYVRISFYLGLGVLTITLIGSPIVMYLFTILGQGQGTEQYVVQIALISSFSLVFRSIREIVSKYLYVRQRKWQPMWLSVVGIVALIGLTLTMVRGFDVDAGIATSFGLVAYNIAWVLAGLTILFRDKRVATEAEQQ
jgi:peptidoglycan biosynthesis protein MviN/MurJ (putative lipid II flippase)